MSEDQNNDVEEFSEQKQKVEITIKKDEKSKSLEQQLEDAKTESEDYKSKLELIAEKEFERKKREVGAPEDIDTPEKLQGFITATKKKGEPAGNVPLSPAQMGYNEDDASTKINSPDSVHSMDFDSYMEMLAVLEARKQMGDDEAKRVLGQLAEKNIHTSSTFEFQGELTKHFQKVKPTEQEAEEKAENKRNWSRKR